MGVTVSAGDLEKYIVDNIEEAIKNDHIKIFYQPIIRTMTGKICAAEALTRWDDPVYGFLSPASFVKALEDAGKIHILDTYVIRTVCKDIKAKIDKGEEPFTVSINLIKADFLNCDIYNVFEEVEQDSGVPAKYLSIEISEGILKDNQEIQETVHKLLERGHEKWLDDFGYGNSSFGALKRHYEVIKFDVRSLHGLKEEELNRARTIIAYSINMVKRLKFSALIEGVETEEEYKFFKDLGCEMIQGYFFSRPMMLKDLEKQGFEVESRDERDYYNAIGQMEIDNGYIMSDSGIDNVEAMALFEYKDQHFSYIYQNEANKRYLQFIGELNSLSAERVINQKSGVLQEKLRPFIKDLEKGRQNLKFSYMYRGNIVNLRAKFIARNPKTNAIALATYAFIMHDENRNRGQAFLRAMREIHTIFDRFDLVDFEDRIIKNSFINTTDYGCISEGISIMEAVEEWCRDAIYPEQRDEFRDFMDIDNVKNKISKLRSKHMSRIFKTQMDNGQYVEKEYVLLPINLDGKEMLLSGIINIDMNGR
ncbi:EAL domain-containing protein [Oribacterium sp. WCC10]|uniref:EAL domain-containing protein n=1 Tax=Oribacterium sp. WCC10 TaxID=1855343 RepID=UPI0008E3EEB2|nr:EAL domain-containing protein [Oribacterium sp. WCC10]SFG81985.1 EAL domain, c-di-GMP-specific phosphodiesterase class I (or its enzymatically inactive variant) [Oribacterium sp. WCC10]